MAFEFTDANFKETALSGDTVSVVDFWAEWCGPCRMIGPIINELTGEYEGKAIMTKLDVDSNPGTAAKYGIRNIPTILFFKNGELADKQVGAVPKNTIAAKIDALL